MLPEYSLVLKTTMPTGWSHSNEAGSRLWILKEYNKRISMPRRSGYCSYSSWRLDGEFYWDMSLIRFEYYRPARESNKTGFMKWYRLKPANIKIDFHDPLITISSKLLIMTDREQNNDCKDRQPNVQAITIAGIITADIGWLRAGVRSF